LWPPHELTKSEKDRVIAAVISIVRTPLAIKMNAVGVFGTVAVSSVAFSPDGKRLACGAGTVVRVWDSTSGEEVLRPLIGHFNFIGEVAFSPDGKRLVSASADDTVRLWDAIGGKQIIGHSFPIKGEECVAFSPNGKWLATQGFNRQVKVWDAANGT